jgi:hypothetical protein
MFSTMLWMNYLELNQLFSKGLLYFMDSWNFLMFSSNVLVTWVVYTDYMQIQGLMECMMVSVSTFLILAQLFYWSQMFTKVAMYWRIILDSVNDSLYFITMVLMLLLAFASALLTLDKMQRSLYRAGIEPIYQDEYLGDEYITLTGDKTKLTNMDNFLTQYLLMLGEFEILDHEAFEVYPQPITNLIWIYFFMATFVTQVVFFNVLVAVIGEAYNSRWEKREAYALQQRTQIYSDYITKLDTRMPDWRYLFVVKPVFGDDAADDFKISEKTIEFLANIADKHFNEESELHRFQNEFQHFREESDKASERQMSKLNEVLSRMKELRI